jgi:hypothetical protein
MTSCTLPLHDGRALEAYESAAWFDSLTRPGVRYQVARVSFGRRIELARRIREIGRKLEFLEAATDARDRLDATLLAAEIDRAYLEWGLARVEGLKIDGEDATPETLVARGPVNLAAEILARIKSECGLNEAERKN